MPAGTTFRNVSVHRFADAESAATAMIIFSDQVVIHQRLQETEPPPIGETTRLLGSAPDGVLTSILYVQQGPIMYRISGSSNSLNEDPTPDVIAVAGKIIS